MMNKDWYVSFETAELAKEKGFDWECREIYYIDGSSETLQYFEGSVTNLDIPGAYFSDVAEVVYTAPTQSLLQKWLREKHGLLVSPITDSRYVDKWIIELGYYRPKWPTKIVMNSFIKDKSDTYEQALEIGLLASLNLIKDGKSREIRTDNEAS